jgi:hypothetical protein
MQMYSSMPSASVNSTVPRLSYGPGGYSGGEGLGGMLGVGAVTGGVGRSDSILTRPYLSSVSSLAPGLLQSTFAAAAPERQRSVGHSFPLAASPYDPGMVRTPREPPGVAGGFGEAPRDYATTTAADDDMPPYLDEDAPLVPVELIRSQATQIQWDRHPCAPIVLLLLNNRGAFLPQHKDLVEYHMAEQMLEALTLLQHGAYFIKYAAKRSTPKERYFMIRVLPDADEKPTPFLTWQLHQNSFQMIDRVPLADLVGITCNAQSIAFRRYLVTPDIIKACHTGTRVAKVSTSGCFSLWFYDRKKGVARSLDLLTCSEPVFSLWTTTFTAILAVNSSAVRTAGGALLTDPRQELRELMLQSQRGVVGQIQQAEADGDYDEAEDGIAAFVEN